MKWISYFFIPACLGYIATRAVFVGAPDIVAVAIAAWVLDLISVCLRR